MKWITVLGAAILLPSIANAEIVTRCGPSAGYGYYFGGPLNPEGPNWVEDGISGGGFDLVRDGEQFDIILTDTIGTRSAKADGFHVVAVPQPTPEYLMILSIAPSTGVVEHYLFQLNSNGNGTALWGSLKGSGSPISKSALYKSLCKHP